jgi:hypothetical protein
MSSTTCDLQTLHFSLVTKGSKKSSNISQLLHTQKKLLGFDVCYLPRPYLLFVSIIEYTSYSVKSTKYLPYLYSEILSTRTGAWYTTTPSPLSSARRRRITTSSSSTVLALPSIHLHHRPLLISADMLLVTKKQSLRDAARKVFALDTNIQFKYKFIAELQVL